MNNCDLPSTETANQLRTERALYSAQQQNQTYEQAIRQAVDHLRASRVAAALSLLESILEKSIARGR